MDFQIVPTIFSDEAWQGCLVAYAGQLRSNDTWSSYMGVLKRFFRDPERTPDLYTKAEVEHFIRSSHTSIRNNGGRPVVPAPSTINLRRAVLSSFYDYSAGFRIVGDDKHLHALLQTPSPTAGIKLEKPAPAHRLLSESDLVALFSAIPQTTVQGMRDRAMFLSYLYLGRRKAELRLYWQDIEPHTFTDSAGQPYQGYRYRYHAKGKGQRWQYAEMPLEVYQAIEWYLIASGRIDSIQPGDGVFVRHYPASHGREPLSSSTIYHVLRKYASAAGLDETVTVHSFRHANAQWRYKCGQGLMEICAAMGHSHAGITWIYLQSLVPENDTGAALLAAKFGPLVRVM